jgi:hypothetical protein
MYIQTLLREHGCMLNGYLNKNGTTKELLPNYFVEFTWFRRILHGNVDFFVFVFNKLIFIIMKFFIKGTRNKSMKLI